MYDSIEKWFTRFCLWHFDLMLKPKAKISVVWCSPLGGRCTGTHVVGRRPSMKCGLNNFVWRNWVEEEETEKLFLCTFFFVIFCGWWGTTQILLRYGPALHARYAHFNQHGCIAKWDRHSTTCRRTTGTSSCCIFFGRSLTFCLCWQHNINQHNSCWLDIQFS